ncbi:sensor histidine kinase [Limimaricola pyoseonensis]|uniref:histidine kinase n=1 Tax=Limimaricola pyoseonensis TaxID=521013 RepID=A0A1G6ZLL3_9RHOB|nr:sensor histidine kinase [Limimaricola pyoseonensis]SDE03137.1 Two-component sensor histidine kinase, contains HisKA and HATPase domains [Limimaricola pyoseonensis]
MTSEEGARNRTARAGGWFSTHGLVLRVVAFLTIALMPIGLIAIYQTAEFQREALRRSELSLLALTGQAAAPVEQTIERALGVAEALGAVIDQIDDTGACSSFLDRYNEGRRLYALIGLVSPDGIMRCSSMGRSFDMRGGGIWEQMSRRPAAIVTQGRREAVADEPLINVATPILEDGEFLGYVQIAIPQRRIAAPAAIVDTDQAPLQLATFNELGEVLTEQNPDRPLGTLLPQGFDLADKAGLRATATVGTAPDGTALVYAVTPLVTGAVYAVGVWPPIEGFGPTVLPSLFPVLMWGASLLVAYYAIHRLVIRHVRRLGRNMRRFGADRQLPPRAATADMSRELREIEGEFVQMAGNILQDEARLEDQLRERGILLKEVHHRVKNNLQLISSIMSMQMRRTRDQSTRDILSRLQDRVLGLATIHRTLYESQDVGRVDAARLMREIVGQQTSGAGGGVDLRFDLEELELLPDQAVPLSLLTSEALANALANMKPAQGETGWIAVGLRRDGDGMAAVEIANAAAGAETEADAAAPAGARSGGLGMNLIQAFSAQLGGPCEISHRDGTYRLSTRFPIRETQYDPQDY